MSGPESILFARVRIISFDVYVLCSLFKQKKSFLKEVFKCPVGLFNYGFDCIGFKKVNTSTVASAIDKCKQANLLPFTSEAIFDLKNEINHYYPRHIIFLNESMLKSPESKEVCFDSTEPMLRLQECTPEATLVCYAKRSENFLSNDLFLAF